MRIPEKEEEGEVKALAAAWLSCYVGGVNGNVSLLLKSALLLCGAAVGL